MSPVLKLLTAHIFFLFAAFLTGYSQGFHTSSNRAMKIYTEGVSNFDHLYFEAAEENFREAVNIDPGFLEAHMMLGELYFKQKKYVEASVSYRAVVKIDSLFYKPVFFSLATSEMMSGDYSGAIVHYKAYLSQTGISEKNRATAIKNLKNCEFAIEALKNPVSFNPENVGSGINTNDDEYWPSITADGQTMIFTRQAVSNGNANARRLSHEDFYISTISGDSWNTSINAGTPLNTSQNEGAQTLSSNGTYMFFTACDRPAAMGSCDIYFSAFSEGKWSQPHNLNAPVNSPYWESQPSISADGRVLFFSSSRPGGYGGKDLYYSILDSNSMWKNPVNLGKTINTDGDEMSPFIHFDGQTLYFSSDGHPGMGGFDMYMTKMNKDSSWSEPKNLGYPINTYNDEMGLIIESGGQKAYFSSVRDKSKGKDIFYFYLQESLRPNPVSYLKGRVFDKETGGAIKAEYELINLSTNKVTIKSSTDSRGNFLVCLPSGNNYGINVSKPGYLFYSENFLFEGIHTVAEPLIKKIILNPIKVGERMLLTNVFYETDSWQIKEESVNELLNLVGLLNDNKDLIMEIGGHTDSTGSEEYNRVLSEKRALSVVNFLIGKGINQSRLKYRGYGNTVPIGDNETPEGRQLNRRTEGLIIERK